MAVIRKLYSVLNHSCKVGLQPRVVRFSSSVQKLPKTDLQMSVPVFRQAIVHDDLAAVHDVHGQYSYHSMLVSSCRFARDVTHYLEGRIQERVAILCPRDASYVVAQWACWISGQIAVPMPDNVSLPLLQHYVTDSEAELVIVTPEHAKTAAKLCLTVGSRLLIMDHVLLKRAREGHNLSTLHNIGLDAKYYERDNALILYTENTTGILNGRVYSHQDIQSQVLSRVKTWELCESDGILHAAPLHHITGIVDALACPLSVGAMCVMLPKINPTEVWSHLLHNKHVNILMASPSTYEDMIDEYEKSLKDKKTQIISALSGKMRLMVNGGAALPLSASQHWEDITGHKIVQSSETVNTAQYKNDCHQTGSSEGR